MGVIFLKQCKDLIRIGLMGTVIKAECDDLLITSDGCSGFDGSCTVFGLTFGIIRVFRILRSSFLLCGSLCFRKDLCIFRFGNLQIAAGQKLVPQVFLRCKLEFAAFCFFDVRIDIKPNRIRAFSRYHNTRNGCIFNRAARREDGQSGQNMGLFFGEERRIIYT